MGKVARKSSGNICSCKIIIRKVHFLKRYVVVRECKNQRITVGKRDFYHYFIQISNPTIIIIVGGNLHTANRTTYKFYYNY